MLPSQKSFVTKILSFSVPGNRFFTLFASSQKFILMEFLNNIKLNIWWKVMVVLGIIMFFSGIYLDTPIVPGKHIAGLGMGFFIIGMTNWAALKHISAFVSGGMLQTKRTVLEPVHRFLLAIGWLITALFGTLILWGLI